MSDEKIIYRDILNLKREMDSIAIKPVLDWPRGMDNSCDHILPLFAYEVLANQYHGHRDENIVNTRHVKTSIKSCSLKIDVATLDRRWTALMNAENSWKSLKNVLVAPHDVGSR